MRYEDAFALLGFNQPWVDLGILTGERAEALLNEYLTSEDKRTEHYRWRAFTSFMEENPTLEAGLMRQIYVLSKTEPDDMLQDSMIHTLIRRDDLPLELLKNEVESPVKSIAKKAAKKLNELGKVS
jgi:hypothetical protein